MLGYRLSMFDTPPPNTIASGSRISITTANARAIRSANRSSNTRACGSPACARSFASPALIPAQRLKPVPESHCSKHPTRPHQSRGCTSSGRAHGSGVWPHSPPMPLAPSMTLRSTTTPPPQPVPRMTPNTTRDPDAAPSTASESAKQLASFSTRTGRASTAFRSSKNGLPLSQTEFAFRTNPVSGDSEPGIATPTVAARAPVCCSIRAVRSATARTAA